MVKTQLSGAERDALVERIATWAVESGIGSLVVFLLEINRPIASLSGNLCIAGASLARTVLPFPFEDMGLLLMEPENAAIVRERIEHLQALHV